MTDREPTIADELPGHWHKVLAALVAKHHGSDTRLREPDFAAIAGKCVVVSHEEGGTVLRVRVLTQAEADRLAELYQKAARRKQ